MEIPALHYAVSVQNLCNKFLYLFLKQEPGSSVSIVSDYGVRSPTEVEDFSSTLCVHTGSEAHPASCTTGTGGKARPGRDADHSSPSSAEIKNAYEL
jgi:hypothetical protein